jgi:protoporphyrinogen oxidase
MDEKVIQQERRDRENRRMKRAKVVIIGAGPAGLAAAYKLAHNNFDVHVFEASPHVGGLARSFELWGQTVDLGPHRFFSSDKIVNEFWREVIGQDHSIVNRLTRIYYRNKFFYYPLQPLNAFLNLGAVDVCRCIFSYGAAKIRPFEPKTFEDWVVGRFGRRLFEIFFKTYTEKVWGIPCARLDAEWASQRIKKLSLFEAVKSAFLKDTANKHKTLVDQFAYPKGGSGKLYEKTAEHIRNQGGSIELNAPVARIMIGRDKERQRAVGVQLQDGRIFDADFVVSTMPLTLMVKSLGIGPQSVIDACNRLYYRNTILAYLEFDNTDIFPDNWIYVHAPEVRHGRIANFRNWCASLTGGKKTTILCIEFWCYDEDPLWHESSIAVGNLAEKELRAIRLIPDHVNCLNSFVLKIPRSYPVYEVGYQKNLKEIIAFVKTIDNVIPIGRNGAFKYNNQDHSILMGLLAAREIITGEPQNIWDINTDSEYQEKNKIADTGIIPEKKS